MPDASEFDAATCFHCGDTWQITRVHPAATGAVAVDLRTCSCDLMRCPHPACKKPIRTTTTAHTCPHCNGRL